MSLLSNPSFRDPAGSLVRFQGRILRLVNEEGVSLLDEYQQSESVRALRQSGKAVQVRFMAAGEMDGLLAEPAIVSLWAELQAAALVEHDAIPFPSYPYEWPPEMLHAAAQLTIDLASALLPEGRGLKDATPLNVLFRGPLPVFIDALSVERRVPGDARWLAYAQFVRTFLLPLAMSSEFGLRLDQVLLGSRDGVEPEEVYRLLKPWQRWKPPYFGLVTMPRFLGERRRNASPEVYQQRLDSNPERARFVMRHVLSSLRKTLRRVAPRTNACSAWSGYMNGNNNYSARSFRAKEQFVAETLFEHRPSVVLDVGCNDGHFSKLAASHGARVVSIDSDPVVVGRLWRAAAAENLDILPLVVNLTRPTPAVGWLNREWPSFLARAQGHFDCVLMLAVIHHMLVSERIPLASILAQAADLTRKLLILEYVGPSDSMFRHLARGREALHSGLSPETLEHAARPHFQMLRKEPLPGAGRILYVFARKS